MCAVPDRVRRCRVIIRPRMFFGHYQASARGVFFDKDGVLFDAHALCLTLHQTRRDLLQMQHGVLAAELYDQTMDITESIQDDGPAMIASLDEAKTLMAHVIRKVSQQDWDVCRHQAVAITDRADAMIDLRQVPILPGALTALQTLKANDFVVGLVTGDNRSRTLQQLKWWGLYDLMDVIVTADDIQHQKPDPEGLLKALNLTHITVDAGIMVGDSVNDWQMAQSIGMPVIAISEHPDLWARAPVKTSIPDLRSLIVVP